MNADVHRSPSYADLILSALDRRPERTAFRWREGDEPHSLTYSETAAQIRGIATALTALHLPETGAVALLTGPRPEAFTIMAAACHAGIRFTALHPLATAHDDDYLLRDSGAAVLIVDDHAFAERAAAASTHVRVMTISELLALADQASGAETRRGSACYLFYTGGTTGEPKGVILPDRSLVANAHASLSWDWPRDTQFLLTTPMSHAAGLLVAPGLLHGATFHIHAAFNPESVLRAIEHDGVNTTFVVPTMLYALLDHPHLPDADLSGLRWILYGAAPTTPSRLIEARSRFGNVLTQHYGQAEAPNALTMLDRDEHATDDHDRLASCGRPMPGVHVALLDGSGAEVQPGAPGELCVRGPLVMDGYWNKPEQTADALRGGWLHTGDVAVRAEDGLITIVDRLKDLIITGGFNVYSREVETVLATHPAVASCAVYGVPDERWGEIVVAAVVLRDGCDASPEELMEHVRAVKGAVWAPKRVQLRSSLPLTSIGKFDKRALREAASNGS
jgi:fatty-acyl-CoA synthase